MANWIFTVTEQKVEGGSISAEDIYQFRMNDEFWGLEEKTPNRRNLNTGDRVVFYVGLPLMIFAGTAVVSAPAFQLNDQQKELYGHGQALYTSDFGVKLSEIHQWSDFKFVKELVPQLQFVSNKEYWYSYFQCGVRYIPDEDFSLITSQRPTSLVSRMTHEPDLESEADFALEAHLEDFIYHNWDSIQFGRPLELYRTAVPSGSVEH